MAMVMTIPTTHHRTVLTRRQIGLGRRVVAVMAIALSIIAATTIPVADLAPDSVVSVVDHVVPDQLSAVTSLVVPDFVESALGVDAAAAWGWACKWKVYPIMALVLGLGAIAVGLMAASGGAVIGGIYFSASALATISAALAGTGSLYGALAGILC